MEFFIRETVTPWIDDDPDYKPDPDALVIVTGGSRHAYTYTIRTLEDLIHFIERHGKVVIKELDDYGPEAFWFAPKPYDKATMPAYEIEIYNNWRE